MSSISYPSGYSKRFKKYQSKLYVPDSKQLSPKAKIVLEPIGALNPLASDSNDKFSNKIFHRSSLTKIIDDKARDYETAIIQHLGLQKIPNETVTDEFSPLTKIFSVSPGKLKTHTDPSLQEDHKTEEINSAVKILDKRNRQMKIRPNHYSEVPKFDLNDSKLIKLKESIGNIREIINKSNKISF